MWWKQELWAIVVIVVVTVVSLQQGLAEGRLKYQMHTELLGPRGWCTGWRRHRAQCKAHTWHKGAQPRKLCRYCTSPWVGTSEGWLSWRALTRQIIAPKIYLPNKTLSKWLNKIPKRKVFSFFPHQLAYPSWYVRSNGLNRPGEPFFKAYLKKKVSLTEKEL